MERTGQCMCGAVKFTAKTTGSFAICYCKMCQRWASGVFMGAQTEGFTLNEGAEHFTIVESSDWAERAFCAKCGSNIYYDADDQDHPNVSLGTFDNIDDLSPGVQWFIDQKPKDIPQLHDVKAYTEAEVMKMFGGDNG